MQRLFQKCTPQDSDNLSDEDDIERSNRVFSNDECGECSNCSNVVCLCGFFCCIPCCTLSGMYGGCYLSLALESLVKATSLDAAAAIITCIPLTSIFSGLASGFMFWGVSTDKAEKWEIAQRAQGKSYSVVSFFKSCCPLKHTESETNPERTYYQPVSTV